MPIACRVCVQWSCHRIVRCTPARPGDPRPPRLDDVVDYHALAEQVGRVGRGRRVGERRDEGGGPHWLRVERAAVSFEKCRELRLPCSFAAWVPRQRLSEADVPRQAATAAHRRHRSHGERLALLTAAPAMATLRQQGGRRTRAGGGGPATRWVGKSKSSIIKRAQTRGEMLRRGGALFVALTATARGADLDITGAPARVRFLNAADTESAVLEGGEGWLNATVRVAAQDFVTSNGASLEALERRLSEASLADLQATISSQQAVIASLTTGSAGVPLASFVSNGKASGEPPSGKLWVAYCARRTRSRHASVWGSLLHGECMATNNGTGWFAPAEPSTVFDLGAPAIESLGTVLDGTTPDPVHMVEWQYTFEFDAARVVLGKPEGNPPAGKVWVAHCLRRLEAQDVRVYGYYTDAVFHGLCTATNNGTGWWAYDESDARYGSPLDGAAPSKVYWLMWLYTIQYDVAPPPPPPTPVSFADFAPTSSSLLITMLVPTQDMYTDRPNGYKVQTFTPAAEFPSIDLFDGTWLYAMMSIDAGSSSVTTHRALTAVFGCNVNVLHATAPLSGGQGNSSWTLVGTAQVYYRTPGTSPNTANMYMASLPAGTHVFGCPESGHAGGNMLFFSSASYTPATL